jgi:hypothetical protein
MLVSTNFAAYELVPVRSQNPSQGEKNVFTLRPKQII